MLGLLKAKKVVDAVLVDQTNLLKAMWLVSMLKVISKL